jgi:hypothetical protein
MIGLGRIDRRRHGGTKPRFGRLAKTTIQRLAAQPHRRRCAGHAAAGRQQAQQFPAPRLGPAIGTREGQGAAAHGDTYNPSG